MCVLLKGLKGQEVGSHICHKAVCVCVCVITGFGLGVDTLVTVINGFWAVRKPGLQCLCLIFTLFLRRMFSLQRLKASEPLGTGKLNGKLYGEIFGTA